MKSQDFLLMLKLVSLQASERDAATRNEQAGSLSEEPAEYLGWQGWNEPPDAIAEEPAAWELYSVRSLSALLGISKSEISASLNRGLDVGLIDPLAFWKGLSLLLVLLCLYLGGRLLAVAGMT